MISIFNISYIFCIIEAVRTVYNQVTDTEIADSIAKWLTQGTLRAQREK